MPIESVTVGPFQVSNLTRADIVRALVELAATRVGLAPVIGFCLHVGGLNAQSDTEYVAAMRSADVVYADGMAIVLLAKLAHGSRVEKTSTTDIGHELIDALAEALSRPVRLGLLGGPPELAGQAGAELSRRHKAEIVFTSHGFHTDWTPILQRLRSADLDLLFVGLGTPKEKKWVTTYRDAIDSKLIVTCGGWMGFLVGAEVRAPVWVQRIGMEWIWRVGQAPRRLIPRYAVGAWHTATLALELIRGRHR